jgi:hypothetical protein
VYEEEPALHFMNYRPLPGGGYIKKHQYTADVNGLKGQLGQHPVLARSQSE